MAPDQRDGGSQRDQRIDEARHPRCRHMHEHDAYRLALLVVGRRDEEPEIEAGGEQKRRGCARPRQERRREAHESSRVGEALHEAVLVQRPTAWTASRPPNPGPPATPPPEG